MLEVIFIVITLGLAIVCALLDIIYSRQGKKQKFPSDVPPNNQRALHYISDNKNFCEAILTILMAMFLSVASALVVLEIGLPGIVLIFGFLLIVLFLVPFLGGFGLSKKLAFWSAPLVRTISEKLKPIAEKMSKAKRDSKDGPKDTGIYTKDDLAGLLKDQKHAKDNSIDEFDLENLLKRLEFDMKKVKDLMQTKKKTKIVGASEAIGPVLINELHETKQQYFLVEEEFNKEIIGTLDIAELVSLKKTGDVKSVMNNKIFYVKDKWVLPDAIEAFYKTGSPVYAVIDSDEEIVGIINIKDVVSELIGDKEMSDFEMFDSLAAVSEADLNESVAKH